MDIYTLINNTNYKHSQQVAKISELLAEKLGYSPGEVSVIRQAAAFHDIGKSAIPKDILDKPFALTPEEFSIVKTHTDEGARQLKGLANVLTIASQIAHEHHERCDGSGYMHMNGNELHTFSKLICVIDVFDALYSRRSYKAGWSVNAVCEYFRSQSGKQFDADMTALVLNNINEILGLYNKEEDDDND